MTTRAVLIVAGLFAAAMAPVAQADTKKHEQKFCDALTEFDTDFKTLQSIGPSSTLAQLRTAADRVDKDASKVEKTAHKIKSDTAKQFTRSAQQLRSEVRSLPADIKIEQALTRIEDDLANVQQSAQKLATESGCPQAAPEMKAQPYNEPKDE